MVDKNRIRLQCNQIRIDLEKKNWFIDPITDFYRGLDHVYLRLATFLIIGQSGLIAFSTYSFEKLRSIRVGSRRSFKKESFDLVGKINKNKTIYCYFSKVRHISILMFIQSAVLKIFFSTVRVVSDLY